MHVRAAEETSRGTFVSCSARRPTVPHVRALVEPARRKGSALVVGLDPIPSRFPRSCATCLEARREPGVLPGHPRGRRALHRRYQAAGGKFRAPRATPGMEVYGDLIADARLWDSRPSPT